MSTLSYDGFSLVIVCSQMATWLLRNLPEPQEHANELKNMEATQIFYSKFGSIGVKLTICHCLRLAKRHTSSGQCRFYPHLVTCEHR